LVFFDCAGEGARSRVVEGFGGGAFVDFGCVDVGCHCGLLRIVFVGKKREGRDKMEGKTLTGHNPHHGDGVEGEVLG